MVTQALCHRTVGRMKGAIYGTQLARCLVRAERYIGFGIVPVAVIRDMQSSGPGRSVSLTLTTMLRQTHLAAPTSSRRGFQENRSGMRVLWGLRVQPAVPDSPGVYRRRPDTWNHGEVRGCWGAPCWCACSADAPPPPPHPREVCGRHSTRKRLGRFGVASGHQGARLPTPENGQCKVSREISKESIKHPRKA